MSFLTILLNLIVSFGLSVVLMCVLFYLHSLSENHQLDLDKLGNVYSKKVGPTLWLILFILFYFLTK